MEPVAAPSVLLWLLGPSLPFLQAPFILVAIEHDHDDDYIMMIMIMQLMMIMFMKTLTRK